jgi:site-specific DNA recombinase
MRNNPLFPYRILVLCPSCRKPFSGSCPRGRSGQVFPAYHCSRKHKYFGVPKTEFDTNFEKFVQRLEFKSEIFDSIEATFLNKYHLRKKEIIQLSINVHQTISELKAQQKAKTEAFVATTSPVLRAQLEKDVEEMEMKIKSAASESYKINITEGDIRRFKDEGKYVLEHLSELLLNPDNATQKLSVFNLIFEERPTYTDIINGTGKLAQPLTLSADESQINFRVDSSGFSWNTIESTIRRWNDIFQAMNIAA